MEQASQEKHDELTKRVLALVSQRVALSIQDIPIDAEFNELGFDSIDAYDVLFSLEEEFKVRIPDESARTLTSISAIVNYLAKNENL
jgi:acyl carrier protein